MEPNPEKQRGIEPLADALSQTYAQRKILPLANQISEATVGSDLTGAEIAAQGVLRAITAARIMKETLLLAEQSATNQLNGYNPFAELSDLIGNAAQTTESFTNPNSLGGPQDRMLEARVVEPPVTPQAAEVVTTPVSTSIEQTVTNPVEAPFQPATVSPEEPVAKPEPIAVKVAEPVAEAPINAPSPVIDNSTEDKVVRLEPIAEEPAALPVTEASQPSQLANATEIIEAEPEVVAAPAPEIKAAPTPPTEAIPSLEEPELAQSVASAEKTLESLDAALDPIDAVFMEKDPTHAQLRRAVLATTAFPDRMKALRTLITHMRTAVQKPDNKFNGISERGQRIALATLDVKESGLPAKPEKRDVVIEGYADLLDGLRGQTLDKKIKQSMNNSIMAVDSLVAKLKPALEEPNLENVEYTILRIADLIKLNPVTEEMTPKELSDHLGSLISIARYEKILDRAKAVFARKMEGKTSDVLETQIQPTTTESPAASTEIEPTAPTAPPERVADFFPAEDSSEVKKKLETEIVIPPVTKDDALRIVSHFYDLSSDRKEQLKKLGISVPLLVLNRGQSFLGENRQYLQKRDVEERFARTAKEWRGKLDILIGNLDAALLAQADNPKVANALLFLKDIDTEEKLEEFLQKL